ncbi:MAG: LacI family DNA-binding transcriptional regulator [Chloroflexia bacterium]|nr:LacI family DNA-binding transcriptional regulator [Chloroflexia bacterium]
MTSIEEVARQAGVSPSTVSRVARNQTNVSTVTRERVQRVITELKYIPNAVARGLKQARSGLIALLITDITSPFFTAVARGAEDAAREAGLSLLLGNSEEDSDLEAKYLRVIGERRVDGVILVPTNQAPNSLVRSLPPEIPIVLLDRSLPGFKADVVRCDTRTGTFVLGQHLLGLGHRRIAIVGGMPNIPTWPERVAGYQAALRESGVAAPPEFVIPGDYNRDGGTEAVRVLLAQGERPDAIIAANAQVALGVLDELVAAGCRVPEDVGVATIDDPFPPSAFVPRLTLVEQPGYGMGEAAVQLLVARLEPAGRAEPPREVVFEATLRIGTSCGETTIGHDDVMR